MAQVAKILNRSSEQQTVAGLTIPFGGSAVVPLSEYLKEVSSDSSLSLWASVEMPYGESASVSVRDFGATGDGIVDDTTAIQNAIDFVASLGGGEVSIPTGVYPVGGVVIGSGITLRGYGDSSVVVLKQGLEAAAIWVEGDDSSVRDLKVVC